MTIQEWLQADTIMETKMNNASRKIVTSLGVLIGVISIVNHGFFEILQGNVIARCPVIHSVAEGNFMGAPAGEAAFTVIPNILYSGIATVLIGLLIILWSLKSIHVKFGSSIFLLLCILQSFVGGGVNQIPFVLIVWGASLKVDKPFKWVEKLLTFNNRWRLMGKYWLHLLIIGMVLVFTATQITLYRAFPFVSQANAISLSLLMLAAGLAILLYAILAGSLYDIKKEKDKLNAEAVSVEVGV